MAPLNIHQRQETLRFTEKGCSASEIKISSPDEPLRIAVDYGRTQCFTITKPGSGQTPIVTPNIPAGESYSWKPATPGTYIITSKVFRNYSSKITVFDSNTSNNNHQRNGLATAMEVDETPLLPGLAARQSTSSNSSRPLIGISSNRNSTNSPLPGTPLGAPFSLAPSSANGSPASYQSFRTAYSTADNFEDEEDPDHLEHSSSVLRQRRRSSNASSTAADAAGAAHRMSGYPRQSQRRQLAALNPSYTTRSESPGFEDDSSGCSTSSFNGGSSDSAFYNSSRPDEMMKYIDISKQSGNSNNTNGPMHRAGSGNGLANIGSSLSKSQQQQELYRCPRCEKQYLCVSNQQRCLGSHTKRGKGAKGSRVPTVAKLDELQGFWDGLDLEQKEKIFDVSSVPEAKRACHQLTACRSFFEHQSTAASAQVHASGGVLAAISSDSERLKTVTGKKLINYLEGATEHTFMFGTSAANATTTSTAAELLEKMPQESPSYLLACTATVAEVIGSRLIEAFNKEKTRLANEAYSMVEAELAEMQKGVAAAAPQAPAVNKKKNKKKKSGNKPAVVFVSKSDDDEEAQAAPPAGESLHEEKEEEQQNIEQAKPPTPAPATEELLKVEDSATGDDGFSEPKKHRNKKKKNGSSSKAEEVAVVVEKKQQQALVEAAAAPVVKEENKPAAVVLVEEQQQPIEEEPQQPKKKNRSRNRKKAQPKQQNEQVVGAAPLLPEDNDTVVLKKEVAAKEEKKKEKAPAAEAIAASAKNVRTPSLPQPQALGSTQQPRMAAATAHPSPLPPPPTAAAPPPALPPPPIYTVTPPSPGVPPHNPYYMTYPPHPPHHQVGPDGVPLIPAIPHIAGIPPRPPTAPIVGPGAYMGHPVPPGHYMMPHNPYLVPGVVPLPMPTMNVTSEDGNVVLGMPAMGVSRPHHHPHMMMMPPPHHPGVVMNGGGGPLLPPIYHPQQEQQHHREQQQPHRVQCSSSPSKGAAGKQQQQQRGGAAKVVDVPACHPPPIQSSGSSQEQVAADNSKNDKEQAPAVATTKKQQTSTARQGSSGGFDENAALAFLSRRCKEVLQEDKERRSASSSGTATPKPEEEVKPAATAAAAAPLEEKKPQSVTGISRSVSESISSAISSSTTTTSSANSPNAAGNVKSTAVPHDASNNTNRDNRNYRGRRNNNRNFTNREQQNAGTGASLETTRHRQNTNTNNNKPGGGGIKAPGNGNGGGKKEDHWTIQASCAS